MEDLAGEVERVRSIVGRFFPIYDVRVRPEAMAFYVQVDEYRLNENFEGLREELKGSQYLPLLRKEGGEHIVYVQRNPERNFRGPVLNFILLIATIGTTVFAGMLLWSSYDGVPDLFRLDIIGKAALFFALPLMAILGTHEMGHFLLARKHRVAASLPFFIPAPLTIIGTFGALISMREPIPNKKALLDIGIAGPLAGLVVAFPVTLLGLWLNALNPHFGTANVGGGTVVNLPLIYEALLFLVPIPDQALLHPTAFAGWVGFLVTALNLLPAGQLDGGHVARALLGERAKYLSYVAFFALMAVGVVYYLPWIILGLFVLLIGLRHPPPLNDLTRLEPGRKAVGLVVLVILLLSFHPIPLEQVPVDVGFEFREDLAPEVVVEAATVNLTELQAAYFFRVNNTGNVRIQVDLAFGPAVGNLPDWDIFFVVNQTDQGGNASVGLDAAEDVPVAVLMTAPATVVPGTQRTIDIVATATGTGGGQETATLTLTVNT